MLTVASVRKFMFTIDSQTLNNYNWNWYGEHTLQAYRFIDPLFKQKKKKVFTSKGVFYFVPNKRPLMYTNEYDEEKIVSEWEKKPSNIQLKRIFCCCAWPPMKWSMRLKETDRQERKKHRNETKRSESTFGQQFTRSRHQLVACFIYGNRQNLHSIYVMKWKLIWAFNKMYEDCV